MKKLYISPCIDVHFVQTCNPLADSAGTLDPDNPHPGGDAKPVDVFGFTGDEDI